MLWSRVLRRCLSFRESLRVHAEGFSSTTRERSATATTIVKMQRSSSVCYRVLARLCSRAGAEASSSSSPSAALCANGIGAMPSGPAHTLTLAGGQFLIVRACLPILPSVQWARSARRRRRAAPPAAPPPAAAAAARSSRCCSDEAWRRRAPGPRVARSPTLELPEPRTSTRAAAQRCRYRARPSSSSKRCNSTRCAGAVLDAGVSLARSRRRRHAPSSPGAGGALHLPLTDATALRRREA